MSGLNGTALILLGEVRSELKMLVRELSALRAEFGTRLEALEKRPHSLRRRLLTATRFRYLVAIGPLMGAMAGKVPWAVVWEHLRLLAH